MSKKRQAAEGEDVDGVMEWRRSVAQKIVALNAGGCSLRKPCQRRRIPPRCRPRFHPPTPKPLPVPTFPNAVACRRMVPEPAGDVEGAREGELRKLLRAGARVACNATAARDLVRMNNYRAAELLCGSASALESSFPPFQPSDGSEGELPAKPTIRDVMLAQNQNMQLLYTAVLSSQQLVFTTLGNLACSVARNGVETSEIHDSLLELREERHKPVATTKDYQQDTAARRAMLLTWAKTVPIFMIKQDVPFISAMISKQTKSRWVSLPQIHHLMTHILPVKTGTGGRKPSISKIFSTVHSPTKSLRVASIHSKNSGPWRRAPWAGSLLSTPSLPLAIPHSLPHPPPNISLSLW